MLILCACFVLFFSCENDDTSFFEMIMSLQKVKNHSSGVYIHEQVALEGINILNMF